MLLLFDSIDAIRWLACVAKMEDCNRAHTQVYQWHDTADEYQLRLKQGSVHMRGCDGAAERDCLYNNLATVARTWVRRRLISNFVISTEGSPGVFPVQVQVHSTFVSGAVGISRIGPEAAVHSVPNARRSNSSKQDEQCWPWTQLDDTKIMEEESNDAIPDHRSDDADLFPSLSAAQQQA